MASFKRTYDAICHPFAEGFAELAHAHHEELATGKGFVSGMGARPIKPPGGAAEAPHPERGSSRAHSPNADRQNAALGAARILRRTTKGARARGPGMAQLTSNVAGHSASPDRRPERNSSMAPSCRASPLHPASSPSGRPSSGKPRRSRRAGSQRPRLLELTPHALSIRNSGALGQPNWTTSQVPSSP